MIDHYADWLWATDPFLGRVLRDPRGLCEDVPFDWTTGLPPRTTLPPPKLLRAATPVHRPGATFICEVPEGAKLLTVGERILLVAPSMPPSWVTPMGLEPIPIHPPKGGSGG